MAPTAIPARRRFLAATLQGSVSAIPGAVSLQNGANVAYNQVSAGTLNSVVSGSGSLIKSGPGLLTVTQGLAYSGATYITGGTLQVAPTAVSTGMYEGLVSGSNGFDTADPIPQTSIQPLARWGALDRPPAATTSIPPGATTRPGAKRLPSSTAAEAPSPIISARISTTAAT